MRKLIALVVGTRPEVIKMAPIWFALRDSVTLQPLLISTGQHREMLAQAFRVFGLQPDRDLALMQPRQALADLTARVLSAVTTVLRETRPAAVLVQGDTTTVLGSALAAFYEKVPLGHVEAGLRTYNYEAPWPEEMNRRLSDPISRWCFAPTEWSAGNLRAERIEAERIEVTGNTVVDALLWVREKLKCDGLSVGKVVQRCQIPTEFAKRYLQPHAALDSQVSTFSSSARRWILVTGHRRESFGAGFEQICDAICELARRYPNLGILYPLHLNPNVQEPVHRRLGGSPRIALIPSVSYEDFIWLMDRCHFVLSDSGGVQEEAPSLAKPVLVMRETTERPEGVQAGTCELVGTDPERILRGCERLLNNPTEYAGRSALRNPYGDGAAARRIVARLEKDLGAGSS